MFMLGNANFEPQVPCGHAHARNAIFEAQKRGHLLEVDTTLTWTPHGGGGHTHIEVDTTLKWPTH